MLEGFSDVDGDTLSVADLTATNGSLVENNGTYTFTPDANYNGLVNLSYNVVDGKGGSTSATQSFTLAEEILLGLAGDDILSGGNGIDNLQGGEGKDRLYGGRGNDLLAGGLGSDIFVLMTQSGTDTIQDFVDGEDKIGLAGGLTFGQLSFSSSNGNTLISNNGGEVLAILANTNSSLITQTDFISVI